MKNVKLLYVILIITATIPPLINLFSHGAAEIVLALWRGLITGSVIALIATNRIRI